MATARKPPVVTAKMLSLGHRAHFYEVKSGVPLERPFVRSLQNKLKASHRLVGSGEERTKIAGRPATAWFAVFEHEAEPSFLRGSKLRERRYGLLVLVHVDALVAVFTAGGIHWSDSFVRDIADRVDATSVGRVLDGAQVEMLSSRNMSLGRNVIRKRTVEADDLGQTLSPLGLNRQIVGNLRVRATDHVYSSSPNTALIAESGPRATLREYMKWVARIAGLLRGSRSLAFLSLFAQPIKMSQMPKGVVPTTMFLDMQCTSSPSPVVK